MEKRLEGHFTGIARYGAMYVLATQVSQLLLLDDRFQTVEMRIIHEDFHGVSVQGDKAYLVETGKNAIGVYQLPALTKVDEIRITQADEDVNHVNDLFIAGDRLLLSMFSLSCPWREHGGRRGAVAAYHLREKRLREVLVTDLHQPHSVLLHEGELYYCQSGACEVKRGSETLFVAPSYTRGLAIRDDTIYVGQSNLRRGADRRAAGIHILRRESGQQTFIPLPSEEVYGILVT